VRLARLHKSGDRRLYFGKKSAAKFIGRRFLLDFLQLLIEGFEVALLAVTQRLGPFDLTAGIVQGGLQPAILLRRAILFLGQSFRLFQRGLRVDDGQRNDGLGHNLGIECVLQGALRLVRLVLVNQLAWCEAILSTASNAGAATESMTYLIEPKSDWQFLFAAQGNETATFW
jgi:hypothetical protein